MAGADRLDVTSDQVVPLDSVVPGVLGLRVLFVNVLAVADAEVRPALPGEPI